MRKQRGIALLVLALLVGGTTGAAAQTSDTQSSGGHDNTAIAVNTKDGSSLFKFSFSITRVMGDTVNTANAAVAYASCTDCQTVALAIQFVLVMGDPNVFTPENLALALNVGCELCDTLASAYQYVIQVSGPVHLTGEGMQRVQEIKRQLDALAADTSLSAFELQTRIEELEAQLQQVMTTELVPAGQAAPDTSPNSTTSTSAPSGSTTTTPSGSSITSASTSTTSSTTTTVSSSTTSTTSAP
jgi:putative peptide zinc metalloprotease protein